MTSMIKKTFLIYILFLFTTLSGSLIQATESSPSEGDLAFQQMKEQIIRENNIVEKTVEQKERQSNAIEKTAEQKIQQKTQSIQEASLLKEQKATEKQLGITPALIEIPAIDARAEVIEVGQTAAGNMEAPANIHTIGWYEPGIKPGSDGNAVLAGHVDGLSGPGTFFNLKKLEIGDEIHITGTGGEELTFVVKEKEAYPPVDAPLEDIFGSSTAPQLNLITCTGIFDTEIGHYDERLVVYTELMES
ncbi:Peptidase C60 sortase A and B [Planococcus antarcticus DSM 14505]|uniref:Peptidase C60 sortase A and B n=1 Tax=Planococcus antarcticus DSM 14505 TaxID=1185653 RepID=A0A1C7DDR1_9BACL|nr:class F sortase [Planococcus antarcticus]ANU09659.1 peptidase C60 sortase A and B [Planococcus antarcticus DSM 14505]EIM04966.1 Peptidase C60 sortase A and B [Planococcus antarcticus DSM 14505]